MALEESKSTSPRASIRPASGRTSPATQSSRVDFPAPDGPNKIVMPEETSMETSSKKEEAPALRRSLRIRAESIPVFTSPPTVTTRGDSPHTQPTRPRTKLPAAPGPCDSPRRIPVTARDHKYRSTPFASHRGVERRWIRPRATRLTKLRPSCGTAHVSMRS